MTPPAAGAAEDNQTTEQLQRRLNSTLRRVGLLLDGISTTLDEPTQRRLFEAVGRSCARTFAGEFMAQHRGDLEGFCRAIGERWGEHAVYDREQDAVHQVSPQRTTCFCPLVRDVPSANPVLCYCSLGFNKETYETVTGRKAEVTAEKTTLRGDDTCAFTIRLL